MLRPLARSLVTRHRPTDPGASDASRPGSGSDPGPQAPARSDSGRAGGSRFVAVHRPARVPRRGPTRARRALRRRRCVHCPGPLTVRDSGIRRRTRCSKETLAPRRTAGRTASPLPRVHSVPAGSSATSAPPPTSLRPIRGPLGGLRLGHARPRLRSRAERAATLAGAVRLSGRGRRRRLAQREPRWYRRRPRHRRVREPRRAPGQVHARMPRRGDERSARPASVSRRRRLPERAGGTRIQTRRTYRRESGSPDGGSRPRCSQRGRAARRRAVPVTRGPPSLAMC